MSNSETIVEIANKLYEARRTLRRLLGRDKYRERVAGMMQAMKSKAGRFTDGATYLNMCRSAMQRALEDGDGMAATWIAAATVELMEPDEWTPTLTDAVSEGGQP